MTFDIELLNEKDLKSDNNQNVEADFKNDIIP
jgi:hypothetical protein